MTQVKHITIAVDAMSGDHGPEVAVPSALAALKDIPNIKIILVGKKEVLEIILNQQLASFKQPDLVDRITIQNATEVVTMQDKPAMALRGKKDSSMRVAINLVNENVAQACVSAGNTGALMATARFVLKTLSGIDRPAIISPMPSKKGAVYALDLGANVECQSEHLFQFAVMASVLYSARHGNDKARVGLLNIGSEAIKGTDAVKRASEMLQNAEGINYIGFVEGNDIFEATADVVVCDGFVGNALLKSSEGLAKLIMHIVKTEYKRNIFTKIIGLLSKPIFEKLFNYFNPDKYNGASLIGLKGVVIKSHGSAKQKAFVNAIKVAALEAKNNVPAKISEQVTALLQDSF